MEMVTVEQAEAIITLQQKQFGTEPVFYEAALGRVLAEALFADRDLPPFNRSTVDGIALPYGAYANGLRTFTIKATQAAGETPQAIDTGNECIEIMTGAALDDSVDTVIRYEDIDIAGNTATIRNIDVKKGQNIHLRGKDKQRGETVANASRIITPALLGLAASIGKTELLVTKPPRIAIITTGDEMVPAEDIPTPYQLRRSNGAMIKAALQTYHLQAGQFHLEDNIGRMRSELARCLQEYDVLLLSGGVSMGRFDHVPQVLDELGVKKLFHKVQQRPGKPFWFGVHKDQQLVFAFPGNPVSVFLCLHRYFIPWLEASLGLKPSPPLYAMLQNDICFPHPLKYFVQVKLHLNDRAQCLATTADTNGSGDFSHLLYTDAFMELPLGKQVFRQGEIYRVWRYGMV